MNLRRTVAGTALLLSAVGSAGCAAPARTSTLSVSADNIQAFVARTAARPRNFTVIDHVGSHVWTVRGVVTDDFRYRATVSVDGVAAYDEVDLDDARWLRVDDASLLFPVDVLGQLRSQVALRKVLSGGWVMDPAGAPPDLPPSQPVDPVPLDPSYVLNAVHQTEQYGDRVSSGFREYNTDAIYYVPKDDKFPRYPADGTRFDKVPPKTFDPQRPPSSMDTLRPDYEYLSIWLDHSTVRRVDSLLLLPAPTGDNRAIYHTIGLAGTARLKALVADSLAAGQPIRETLLFGSPPAAAVTAPAGATRVDLNAVLRVIRVVVHGVVDPAPDYGPVS